MFHDAMFWLEPFYCNFEKFWKVGRCIWDNAGQYEENGIGEEALWQPKRKNRWYDKHAWVTVDQKKRKVESNACLKACKKKLSHLNLWYNSINLASRSWAFLVIPCQRKEKHIIMTINILCEKQEKMTNPFDYFLFALMSSLQNFVIILVDTVLSITWTKSKRMDMF